MLEEKKEEIRNKAGLDRRDELLHEAKEALLFRSEDGIRVRQLAELLSLPPTGIQQSLEKLAQKYEERWSRHPAGLGRSIRVARKPQFAEF